MSIAIVVRCDGTPEDRPSIPLGQCRAGYPTQTELPTGARYEAQQHGWSAIGARDLCPSCTRSKAQR